MANRNTSAKKASRSARRRQDGTDSPEDRSFGKVLRTKSTERIVPEAVNRFEAGRRLYTKDGVTAAEAELELLVKERKCLEENGDKQGPKHDRLDRLIATVKADIATGKATLEAIERAVAPTAGGWTVIGRVVRRDGAVPTKAEVLFIAENNKPVEELGVIELGADGMVRTTYPADVVKRLMEKRVRVMAAIRVSGRIIATDETPVRVRPGHVHLFDLRIEIALDP